MSQVTDYTIVGAPSNMAAIVADVEAMFAAAISQNRGATAPASPEVGMFWLDTSGGATACVLKIYTAGGWVALLKFNSTAGTVTGLSALLDEDNMASDSAVLPPSQRSVKAYADQRMLLTGANLAIGSDADGDMYYRASSVLARLAKGAANTKLFINAGATAPEWASGIKVLASSRDNTAASGDVAYTGVGFKPTAIVCFAQIDNNAQASWGMWEGLATNDRCSALIYTTTMIGKSNFIWIQGGSSDFQAADVKTADADGVTLTWTKGGSPGVGTINLFFLFLR